MLQQAFAKSENSLCFGSEQHKFCQLGRVRHNGKQMYTVSFLH
jgi:hypothetical protein